MPKPKIRPRKRRKFCKFCKDSVRYIDYKNTELLSEYLNKFAKIEPRRKTGVCAKHQRMLATAIKRARMVGLLPFTKF